MRVALISDLHGNQLALAAVLRATGDELAAADLEFVAASPSTAPPCAPRPRPPRTRSGPCLPTSMRDRAVAAIVLAVAACGDGGSAPADAAPADVTVIVEGLGALGDLAVDADAIYAIRGDEVVRIGHDGSGLEVVASAQKSPCCLAASGGDVYWVEAGRHAADFLDGSVMRLPAGADTAVVAVANVYFPADVVADPDAIHWVEIDGGGLGRAARDGSNPAELYWSETSKTSLAITDQHVAWTAGGPSEDVVARDRGSGVLTIISGEEYSPTDLLATGDDLYWVEQGMLGSGLDRIRRSIGLGAPEDVAIDELGAADLVAGGDHVYWIAAGAGTVRRVAIAGGVAETFAAGQGELGGLAVHDGHLYWTDPARGAIVRAAMP